jgi:hypothetical protein
MPRRITSSSQHPLIERYVSGIHLDPNVSVRSNIPHRSSPLHSILEMTAFSLPERRTPDFDCGVFRTSALSSGPESETSLRPLPLDLTAKQQWLVP